MTIVFAGPTGHPLSWIVNGARGTGGEPSFDFEVVTTAPSETFALPLEITGTYDFDVDWGDGNSDTITVYNESAATHTYITPGTHDVSITREINGWSFNNLGDKDKIYDISSWGPLLVGNSGGYFYGCTNLTVSATDVLNLTAVQKFDSAFQNCTSVTTIASGRWNTSNFDRIVGAFRGCTLLAHLDVSGWNMAMLTKAESAWRDCSALLSLAVGEWSTPLLARLDGTFRGLAAITDLPLSGIDIPSLINATLMLSGTVISTAELDATFISWEGQPHQLNVTADFGTAKYTAGGAAEAALNALLADGWIITTGGPAA